MSGSLAPLSGTRRITWRTVIGVLLVPLTVAGVLLWGLWNPTDRLDSVTAAVVNLDEPVTVDGQTVPMGRLLAGELIGDPRDAAGSADDADDTDDTDTAGTSNFTWVLTDADDAAAGLDDGRYTTVVTIPENFSSAATSASRGADEARTATIDVQTSERGRLLDQALSSIVTTTATSLLNEQLGSQYVGNIFVGMTALGTGISDAADGAAQLADGGAQLAGGADELALGVAQLSSGTAQLSSGTSGLASGASQLAASGGQLASGANELASGASQLAAGQRATASGAAELATGVESYVGGINGAVTGIQEQTVPLIAQVRQAVEADLIPPFFPEGSPTKELTLQMLDAVIFQLSPQDTTTVPQDQWTDLTKLIAGGNALASGTRELANGQAELATGSESLATGLSQYASGVAQYSSGVGALATGAAQLDSGAAELASGTAQLSTGATQLADGTRQAADGSTALAEGLATAAEEVPTYTDAQRERLSETLVSPVSAAGTSDELFNASGVPLFAGIALWAGGLAAFLVLAPLWRRSREAARGIAYVTFRSALPAIGIGAAQGAIAGVILPTLLGYDLSQWLGFFALSLVAGISFGLVNQGLSALLGGFGRFLSFALLVVAFAIGVISTAPPLLQTIGDASPIGALFTGFQAVAVGVSGSGLALWLLAVWGIAGLLLTGFAVARERRSLGAITRAAD